MLYRPSNRQLRMHRILRTPALQHLGMGVFVLAVSLLFFGFRDWPPEEGSSFYRLLSETFFFTLSLSVPAYFNLMFVYKGLWVRPLLRRFIPDATYKGWVLYIFLLFSLLTSVVFGLLFNNILEGNRHIPFPKGLSWLGYSLAVLLAIFCTTAVAYASESVERVRRMERMERRDAIKKQQEAERKLAFIKHQVRPHFLFNTLANLQVLAIRNSDKLPALIGQLSNLLRHLIYLTDTRMVRLDNEIEFIKSYVNLRRLSLEEATDIRLELSGTSRQPMQIAPMILLLFVENCFKHFNKHSKEERFIRVSISFDDEKLSLRTANSFQAKPVSEDHPDGDTEGGIGQRAAVEHLDLIYGNRYFLEKKIAANTYLVHLDLPLELCPTATLTSS